MAQDEGVLESMYKVLKSDKNYTDDLPNDVNDFKKQLQDSSTANQFYDALKKDKSYSNDIPDTFDDFYSQLKKKASSEPATDRKSVV